MCVLLKIYFCFLLVLKVVIFLVFFKVGREKVFLVIIFFYYFFCLGFFILEFDYSLVDILEFFVGENSWECSFILF